MHNNREQVKSKVLIGTAVSTSFVKESNPLTSEITKLVGAYIGEKKADKIPERKNPNVSICAYFNYSNKYLGDYTYFIGEEVNENAIAPEGMIRLEIPAGTYLKVTTEPGIIPYILMNAWHKIWQLFENAANGNRLYHVDFEVYDARAKDPQKSIVDIYVGVK